MNVIGDRLDTPFDPVDSDSVNKDNIDKFKYILSYHFETKKDLSSL